MSHQQNQRVDFETLERFIGSMEREVEQRMRPRARAGVSAIDDGGSAIGMDRRFTEAHDVHRRGEVTAVSAHEFVDLLVRHVDALGSDVRRAARRYEDMDVDAADLVNLRREELWLARSRADRSDCHLFYSETPRGRREEGDVGEADQG